MVSAEAGMGKHFSLSAFSMAISGSIESFSLCNSQDKDFTQKIPCISDELVNSVLSLVLILRDVRRPSDTWYSKWLNDFRWKNCTFPFFYIIILMWAFVYTFPVPFWALKVKSIKFPSEESVWGEMLVTEILHQEEFRSGSGLPSSSSLLAWRDYLCTLLVCLVSLSCWKANNSSYSAITVFS